MIILMKNILLMKDTYYTDTQFNQFIEILIQYKKCCPRKGVYMSDKSFREATEYFMKTGMFEAKES